MLFSDASVAKLLNDKFECAWQELRPVPQVKIDFGNGRVLRRTLAGNVATWICTADGSSLDVIPALATASTYTKRLKDSLELHWRLNQIEPHLRKKAIAGWHSSRATPVAKTVYSMPRPVSKMAVERPIKQSLASTVVPNPAVLKFLSKSGVERPIKQSFLVRDNRYNQQIRAPLAHKMLATSPGLKPSELTHVFFKTVLNVDIRDPYLGLAPYVLGGEPGRG